MKRLILALPFLFCWQVYAQQFKVIGYYPPSDLPVSFEPYTHINFSFAIPAKTGDTLIPLRFPERVHQLVETIHSQNKKIFISIGGWGIGDAPGDDTRFHKMAETEQGRSDFINSTMKMVRQFNFDGVDLDWEYPDENSPSAEQYVWLVSALSDSLHREDKELSAAVISYGSKGYGILKEAFEYMDWLNLMAYDDDYGPDYIKAHSPFSLALKSLEFWINERGLPPAKAVLGLPYYAKRGMGNFGSSYKDLLTDGASPYDDYWKGNFYNGKNTIRDKVRLALDRGIGGAMVWEIKHDTDDENSLGKVIVKTIEEYKN